MSDEFVPLSEFLAPRAAPSDASPPPVPPTTPSAECEEALRAARRFHAGVSDAVDAALPELLRAIATEVLARELRLGGAEIAAVVAAALDRFRAQKIVSIHANPEEAGMLSDLEIHCVPCDGIAPGDLRIELRSGTIDLSLAARLEAALSAWPR